MNDKRKSELSARPIGAEPLGVEPLGAETLRHAFHEELDLLHKEVDALGHMGIVAVERGTEAFLTGELDVVERVIAQDKEIDELMFSIEVRSYELVARQQPMAIDLRTLIAIMRVIHELERVGDNMVNVVKAARRMHPYTLSDEVSGLINKMREQAIAQLTTALEAFSERDTAKAAALQDMDDFMDDLQKDLFRTIFRERGDDDAMQRAVQLALVGRYYERVADHAVNVGERVPFMVSGWTTEPSG